MAQSAKDVFYDFLTFLVQKMFFFFFVSFLLISSAYLATLAIFHVSNAPFTSFIKYSWNILYLRLICFFGILVRKAFFPLWKTSSLKGVMTWGLDYNTAAPLLNYKLGLPGRKIISKKIFDCLKRQENRKKARHWDSRVFIYPGTQWVNIVGNFPLKITTLRVC